MKSTWFIDSPSKLHTWHLESTFIPLAIRLSITVRDPLTAFHRKILIFGTVSSVQMKSLIPLSDGSIDPTAKAYLFANFSTNQYHDLTEYAPVLV